MVCTPIIRYPLNGKNNSVGVQKITLARGVYCSVARASFFLPAAASLIYGLPLA